MKRRYTGNIKRFSYIMIMILIAAMIPTVSFAAAPSDIGHHWAKSQIADWVEKGYINGYGDGTFQPDSKITRAEFMALVNRAFSYTENAAIAYPDVKPGTWISDAVSKAKAAGYISGYSDGTIRPDNYISRQEAASIMAKITGMEADVNAAVSFRDASGIPAWSKGSIGAVVNAGIMNGYPDGSFQAAGLISRAEAVVAIHNASGVSLTCTTPGSYGPETGIQTVKGNVTVRCGQVTLQNMNIAGKLILAEGIGEGEVTLKHVTVASDTEILGGGENSIIAIDSSFGKVIVSKANGKIRIVVSGTTSIKEIIANSSVKMDENNLTGKGYQEVIVDAEEDDTIYLYGSFQSVEIRSEGTTVVIPAGTTVSSMILNRQTRITGTGSIGKAVIGANGVIFTKAPELMELAPGINPPTILGTSSGGGGGTNSGGGGNDDDGNDSGGDGNNEGGTHPAPAAPTMAQNNDFYNSFGWEFVTGFASPLDYEYTTDGGINWTVCSDMPQYGFDGNIPAGNARIRVKADPASGRPAGLELQSNIAYTVNSFAQLTNLELSGTPSNFSFTESNYTYLNVTVPSDQATITVTPTLAGGNLSITYEYNGRSLNSGETSPEIALVAGVPRKIALSVSKLGYITNVYEIYVTRQGSPASFTANPQTDDITLPSPVVVNLTIDKAANIFYAVVPETMIGYPTPAPSAEQLIAIGTPGEAQIDHYGVVPVLAGGAFSLEGGQPEQIMIPTNEKFKANQTFSIYFILENGSARSEIVKTDFNTLPDENTPVFNQFGNGSGVWDFKARSVTLTETINDYDERYQCYIWAVKPAEAPAIPSPDDIIANGILYEDRESGKEYHTTVTGLEPATEYSIYMIAEDCSDVIGLKSTIISDTITTVPDTQGPDKAGISDEDCYVFSNEGDILNKYMDIQMDELLGSVDLSVLESMIHIWDRTNDLTLAQRGDTVAVHGDTLTITFHTPPTDGFELYIKAGALQDTDAIPHTNAYEISIDVYPVPDITKPAFNNGFPAAYAAGTDNESVAAEVRLYENTAVFWVLLADNAAAPVYESNIIDRVVSGAIGYGSLSIDNDAPGIIRQSGLQAGTNYDLWITAIDANHNFMVKEKIDLTTGN